MRIASQIERRSCLRVAVACSLSSAAVYAAGENPVCQSQPGTAAKDDAQTCVGTKAARDWPARRRKCRKHIAGGFDLPNGWRITPAGKAIATIEDLVLNLVGSPDGRIVIASHSGYLPHGIDVFDTKTQKQTQHIEL